VTNIRAAVDAPDAQLDLASDAPHGPEVSRERKG
jgi:hypothetical protein